MSENDGMSVVSGDEPVPSLPEPVLEIPFYDVTPPIREAFRRLDGCDVEQIFARRGCVMKSVPFFLKGPFRSALRIALEATADEHVRRSRGWKLFLLFPRMLLSRRPRGGSVSREKLRKRFELFTAGQWEELIGVSQDMANEANVVMRRQRRRPLNDEERRAAKAHMLVQLGELLAGRAALEAADLAPGTNETLQQ